MQYMQEKKSGMISFEKSFEKLIEKNILDITTVSKHLDCEQIKHIIEVLGG